MAERIEWAYDATAAWPLRAVRYGPAASLGGFIALAVGAYLWVAVRAILAGRLEWVLAIGVGVAVLLAVRGRVLVAIADPSVRESLPAPTVDPAGALVAAVAGGVVLWLAAGVSVTLAIVLFGVGVLAAIPAGLLRTSGSVDPDRLHLSYEDREVDLRGLVRFRETTVGAMAFCWLTFERGSTSPIGPRLLVVPAMTWPRVRDVLDAATDVEVEASPMPQGERVLAALVGACLLAAGPALWVILPPGGDARLFAGYAGMVTGMVGLFLLWYVAVD